MASPAGDQTGENERVSLVTRRTSFPERVEDHDVVPERRRLRRDDVATVGRIRRGDSRDR